MLLSQIAIALLAVLPLSSSCVVIFSTRGMIGLVPHNATCTYVLNGDAISVDVLTSHRAYGLIQASCDDCVTSHIIKFTGCDDCWICSHNEGLMTCRSRVVPIFLAVSLSVVGLLMIVYMIYMLTHKLNLNERMMYCMHRRTQSKNERKMNKKMELIDRALLKRLATKVAPEQLTSNEEDCTTEMGLPQGKKRPRTQTLGGSVAPAVLLALGMLPGGIVDACDNVLFVSASGALYVDGSMSMMSTGLAYLHAGSTLCLKHQDGSQEELTVDKISVVENYGASYKTCDFSLDFKSYSACLGSDLCWNAENCHQGTRYASVGPKAYTLPDSQTGCRLVPNMDDPCTHRQKCVWYIIPLSHRCDIIYQILDKTTLVHFTHKSPQGNVVPFSLSLDKPFTAEPIIVHLGSATTEYYPTYKNVRKHGDIPLGVTAADINQGMAGLLGDLQLPLTASNSSAKWSYPLHEIMCQPDGRTMMCRSAPPAYKLTITENSRHVLEGSFDHSQLSFRRTRQVRGVVSVMLRTNPVVGQIIEQASCQVAIESSYGCMSCDEMPYVVIRPHSISATGMLRFSSNCSFYLPEVSCSDQPQMLRLTGRAEICELKFKDTNQSLVININYEFLGQIYYRGVMTYKPEESFSSKMKLAIQSPDFLTSLQYSMAIGVISAATVAVLKMMMKYWAFGRGMKDEANLTA